MNCTKSDCRHNLNGECELVIPNSESCYWFAPLDKIPEVKK